MTLIFGRVDPPVIDHDIIDASRRDQSAACRGYDMLGWRPDPPEFLVIHKAQSPADSTLGSPGGYFTGRCCPALTDLEVNSVTGRGRRFVERGNAPSGWANGKVSGAYGDALKYLDLHKHDYSRANRNGEACEILGRFAQPGTSETRETEVGPEAREWLARWMAWRADQYGIPWSDFPVIKAEGGRSYITWHQEWTIGTGKVCPGVLVMQLTPALIERATQIMRAAQETESPVPVPPPIVYVLPELPAWWAEMLAAIHPSDATVDGDRWYAMRRNVAAVRTTVRRSEPDTKAPPSGPRVPEGEKVHMERIAKINGRQWLIEDGGHFLLASAFSPRIQIDPRKAA